MKRLTIIFITIAAVIIIGLTIILIVYSRQSEQTEITVSDPSSYSVAYNDNDKIVIDTEIGPVEVNDFYSTAVGETGTNGVILAQTDKYIISFYPSRHEFIISLTSPLLATARTEAELKFLEITGVTEKEACALDVYITTQIGISRAYAGKEFGFSFCPGSIDLSSTQ